MKVAYAIETLKIEEYKLIARLRKIKEDEENLEISFSNRRKEIEEKLADIEFAILQLENTDD